MGGTFGMSRMFIAKMALKETPLRFAIMLSFGICCVLTYILWVFERAYCAPWAPQYWTEDEIILRCSIATNQFCMALRGFRQHQDLHKKVKGMQWKKKQDEERKESRLIHAAIGAQANGGMGM